MVKINQTHEPVSARQNMVPSSKNIRTEAFKNALDKALDKTGPPGMDTFPTRELDEIPPKNLTFTSVSDRISDRTDQLLQMLDMYSAKLRDPNITLKDIAPVLEDIQTMAGRLLEATTAGSDIDPQLKRIAKEAALTAHVEYFKFQRGDYLS